LKKEIRYFAEKFFSDREIISIFFGGGTPSFMAPDYIGEIIEEIKKNFSVKPDAEITLETNPGTVSAGKLENFLNIGINRISIGIQSFDENELRFLTRIHNPAAAKQTVLDAKHSGFNNISIDLIFNLPGQTKDIWRSNLEQSLYLPINHISAYSLILEPGTMLNKMVIDGKVKLQDDDYDADLYELTIEYLTQNGFTQYEVSNFAKEGFESVHNNAYWRYKDYIGFGTSAHSFVDGMRWWNYSSLKFYIESVNKINNAVIRQERLTQKQKLDEYIMLALRSKGLDKIDFEKRFKTDLLNKNRELITLLLNNNFIRINNGLISLTPKGYAVCDEILKRFL
jgi:oxygen-independent coproporphyrinogen-3 oxidase